MKLNELLKRLNAQPPVHQEIELVIKIDKNVFTRLFDNGIEDYEIANDDLLAIVKSIRKGVPLPEGHGKIVDLGKIDEDKIEQDNPVMTINIYGTEIEAVSLDYLNNLPPILEANKEV